jgi:hypothetical protein
MGSEGIDEGGTFIAFRGGTKLLISDPRAVVGTLVTFLGLKWVS